MTAPALEAAMPVRRLGNRRIVAMLAFGVVVAALVPMVANAYWISTLTSAFALALACAGTGLLYGQLGLVSLCQYALLGVGGWIALRLGHAGLPFGVAVLAGGTGAAAIGVLAGLPALRLRGLYLALVTLMLTGAFQVVINAWGFPDGGDGFFGRVAGGQRQMMERPLFAVTDAGYFRYVVAAVVLGLVVIELHRRARPGRAWALIRKSEVAAQAAGVDLLLYKAWAFALSGFLAGIAGGLLAGGVGQLDGRAFAASESVMLFALSVVGGVGHWLGAVIAGLLLRAAPSLLNDFGVNGFLAMVFFGAALLHALCTAPEGIAGQILGLLRKAGRK